MSNKDTWNRKDVVACYAAHADLQSPEATILGLLKDELPRMTMLDIGVGGGRTTLHFAKLARKYVGIDCSEQMIAACKQRFADSENVSFEVCDVASMDMFNDNVFDFVLFSFNGIDCVSRDDRARAFHEIQRVTKPGGYFCFSTHNIQSVSRVFHFELRQFSRNLLRQPAKAKAMARDWFLLRFVYNEYASVRKLKSLPYVILNDGAHDYGLEMYYINPTEQIRQLRESCSSVRVFSLSTGREIEDTAHLSLNEDPWLYYLCRLE